MGFRVIESGLENNAVADHRSRQLRISGAAFAAIQKKIQYRAASLQFRRRVDDCGIDGSITRELAKNPLGIPINQDEDKLVIKIAKLPLFGLRRQGSGLRRFAKYDIGRVQNPEDEQALGATGWNAKGVSYSHDDRHFSEKFGVKWSA